MSTLTPESAKPRSCWPAPANREGLRAALHAAIARSERLGRPIVASYTQPALKRDLADIFVTAGAAGLTELCYWEQPAERSGYVGLGAAARVSADGADNLGMVADAWRAMLRDAVIAAAPGTPSLPWSGPLGVGGFAFDPLSPRTALWQGFPDALMVLPRLLFGYREASACLTFNALVAAGDDAERHAAALLALAMRLEDDPEPLDRHDSALPAGVVSEDLELANAWMQLVAAATERIRNGALRKVVLARGVEAWTERPINAGETLRRLRDASPTATLFALRLGGQTFLGATPERLARVEAGRVATMALAGTAPRGATADEDAALGAALLASAKERDEQAIVVSAIRDALARLCTSVSAESVPHLRKLPNVQHLESSIAGMLTPGRNALDVAAVLHPTPAVGGFPRAAALDFIRAHERLDRGWYAGPVGWLGARGEGEFAVALRSALVSGDRAMLFAGCGIVAGSDPRAEYEESRLKLAGMLRVLGGAD